MCLYNFILNDFSNSFSTLGFNEQSPAYSLWILIQLLAIVFVPKILLQSLLMSYCKRLSTHTNWEKKFSYNFIISFVNLLFLFQNTIHSKVVSCAIKLCLNKLSCIQRARNYKTTRNYKIITFMTSNIF